MIKLMTRNTGRTKNAKIVVKKDIQRLIAQRLKIIKKMMTRAQGLPVVERA